CPSLSYILMPPRSPSPTLFPYTTLFRSDIVVFDPERIRDTATFFEPHGYPEGIVHVLVNGQFVVEDGNLTMQLPGAVLTKQRARSEEHTSELQSREKLVCRLLLEKKNTG